MDFGLFVKTLLGLCYKKEGLGINYLDPVRDFKSFILSSLPDGRQARIRQLAEKTKQRV